MVETIGLVVDNRYYTIHCVTEYTNLPQPYFVRLGEVFFFLQPFQIQLISVHFLRSINNKMIFRNSS